VCLGKINYTPHLRHADHAANHPRVHPILILAEIVPLALPRVGEEHVSFDSELESFLWQGISWYMLDERGGQLTLSGWCLRLSFQYAFLISTSEQSRETPTHPHQPRASQQRTCPHRGSYNNPSSCSARSARSSALLPSIPACSMVDLKSAAGCIVFLEVEVYPVRTPGRL